ncbi:hypothetical protein AWH62_06815 [Maricaulis sp. W15]|nr:hypothetical protein AWH62_06815 [Maricaulis sp. W15]
MGVLLGVMAVLLVTPLIGPAGDVRQTVVTSGRPAGRRAERQGPAAVCGGEWLTRHLPPAGG